MGDLIKPIAVEFPTDPETGLIPPLSKLLGSSALIQHRLDVALELEVMAKKYNRFGWDNDRGSPAHDRLITDWVDALSEYPIKEIQAACRSWVRSNPRRMPNEGDILKLLQHERALMRQQHKARNPVAMRPRLAGRVSAQRAAEIVKEVGFNPKGFGGVGHGS